MPTNYTINVNPTIVNTTIAPTNVYLSSPIYYATFQVQLSKPRPTVCTVNYTWNDSSALNFQDYIAFNGILSFPAGTVVQTLSVPILTSIHSSQPKQFTVTLSNPVNCNLSSITMLDTGICTIAAAPAYPTVPFPGNRMALLGDSITGLNTHWQWANWEKGQYDSAYNPYFQSFLFSNTGYFVWANALINDGIVSPSVIPDPLTAHRFELEIGLQPNADPLTYDYVVPTGANIKNSAITVGENIGINVPSNAGTGYNFAVAGSMVANWGFAADQTLSGAVSVYSINPTTPYTPPAALNGGNPISGNGVQVGLAIFNKGPMYSALNNITKFDCVTIMGGINDLSGNAPPNDILNLIIQTAYILAQQGKWVFIVTLLPRTTMAPNYLPTYPEQGLSGYTWIQQLQIQLNSQIVNQGLRDWISTTNPPGIWLVDVYNDLLGPHTVDTTGMGLVGPYNTLMTGPIALDPFGWISPANFTGVVNPAVNVATRGNYNPNYPGEVTVTDGLHPSPVGAEIIGRKLAAAWTAAGVPHRASNTVLGPINLGDNILFNPGFTVTSTYPSATIPGAGFSTKLGRAIGLGAPLTDPTHTGGGDSHSNMGLGYTYGPVPDYWFVYRSSNSDADYSESNFNNFGFSGYLSPPTNVPSATLSPYVVDPSPWSDGALITSIVTVNGITGFQLNFNVPQSSAAGAANQSFLIRTYLPHFTGPWSNYSTDTGPAPAAPQGPPNTLFVPGDMLMAEAELHVSNLTNNLFAIHMSLGVEPYTQQGQTLESLGLYENFWPIDDIDNMRFHSASKNFMLHSPAITVPAYAQTTAPSGPTGQTQYMALDLCFTMDTRTSLGSMQIIVLNPSVRKVTSISPAL